MYASQTEGDATNRIAVGVSVTVWGLSMLRAHEPLTIKGRASGATTKTGGQPTGKTDKRSGAYLPSCSFLLVVALQSVMALVH